MVKLDYSINDINFKVITNNNTLTLIKENEEPLNIKYKYQYCNEIDPFSDMLYVITTTDFNLSDSTSDNTDYELFAKHFKEIIFNYIGITEAKLEDFKKVTNG